MTFVSYTVVAPLCTTEPLRSVTNPVGYCCWNVCVCSAFLVVIGCATFVGSIGVLENVGCMVAYSVVLIVGAVFRFGVLALLALSAADAGVKTITVPSTVVRKLRKPLTVTVGSAVLCNPLFARTSAAGSGKCGGRYTGVDWVLTWFGNANAKYKKMQIWVLGWRRGISITSNQPKMQYNKLSFYANKMHLEITEHATLSRLFWTKNLAFTLCVEGLLGNCVSHTKG